MTTSGHLQKFLLPVLPAFPTDPNADFVENIKGSGIFTGGTEKQAREQWQQIYTVVHLNTSR